MVRTITRSHEYEGEEDYATTNSYVLVRTIDLALGETTIYLKNIDGANAITVQLKDNFDSILQIEGVDETELAAGEDIRYNVGATGIGQIKVYVKSTVADNHGTLRTDACGRRI